MKTTLLLAFSLLLLPLSAQEEAKEPAPIEKLLKITKFEENIVETGAAGFSMVKDSLAAEELHKEEMAEVKDAFVAYLQKLASDPTLKAKTIELYQKNFTDDEINELVAFYETTVGQKTLNVLPSLTGKIMTFSQKLAQEHVVSFQEALTQIIARKNARKQGE